MAFHSIPDAPFEFSSSSFPPGHLSPPSMCAADDVFHMGMLLPLGAPPPPPRKTRGPTGRSPPHPCAQYHRLRSASKSEHAGVVGTRPSYRPLCLLGAATVPATMDMREIRSRQRRRARVPAAHGGGGSQGATSWRLLLRSLSCKGTDSAGGVAQPYGIFLHVRGA